MSSISGDARLSQSGKNKQTFFSVTQTRAVGKEIPSFTSVNCPVRVDSLSPRNPRWCTREPCAQRGQLLPRNSDFETRRYARLYARNDLSRRVLLRVNAQRHLSLSDTYCWMMWETDINIAKMPSFPWSIRSLRIYMLNIIFFWSFLYGNLFLNKLDNKLLSTILYCLVFLLYKRFSLFI